MEVEKVVPLEVLEAVNSLISAVLLRIKGLRTTTPISPTISPIITIKSLYSMYSGKTTTCYHQWT